MKQTITIEVPEGKTYKQTTDKDGNIIIQYVDNEPVRSKTWEEFCENNPVIETECLISGNSNIKPTFTYQGLPGSGSRKRLKHYDNNLLSTKEDAEGILALIQLTRLHDEWVGDWKPDWPNYKERKYAIVRHRMDYFYVEESTYLPRLLSFPSREMTQEFLDCFRDLIKTAKRFIY